MGASGEAWRLTTDDFRMLWTQQDGSDYPPEFLHPGAPDADPDDRERAEKLDTSLTPSQRAAMATLTRPGGSIGVTGIDASRDFADPSHHLRLIAAWQLGGEHAYIARQKVSADIGRGAAVTITRHLVASVTTDIVGHLPPAVSLGRLPVDNAVEFVHLPVLAEKTIPVVAAAPPATAAAAFTHPSPSTCGAFRIQIGSVTDGRPPTTMQARYRDIPDDGRYLLIIDKQGTALPADAVTLAKMLNRAVNLTRKRHTTATAS